MKLTYIYDSFTGKSKKTGDIQTYYVVRLALVNSDNSVLRKSEPLIWLTKEQFDELSK